jgi:DNA-binding MarR family transcriptional regulator
MMPNLKQLKLIHSLLLLSKKAKRLDELLLEGLNITINELYILYAADQQPILSLKDLKSDLQIQPASLSRVLGNMYNEELIERSFSGHDRRSINIALTDK